MVARHLALVGGLVLLAASGASAQSVDDARAIKRQPWRADTLTARIVKGCAIPRAYFRVDRDYDGYARMRESPSVTPDQHKCATSYLVGSGIPVRK